MAITTTANLALGQISVDHPPGADWINRRNSDMAIIDALFLDNQKSLGLLGTSAIRLLLQKTSAGFGELRMVPFGATEWRLIWGDNAGGSGVNASSLEIWRGVTKRLSYAPAGDLFTIATVLQTGTEAVTMQVSSDIQTNNTPLVLLCNNGSGVFATKRVIQGATNSGGSGFRLLLVVN
jgi:hypothetical protein